MLRCAGSLCPLPAATPRCLLLHAFLQRSGLGSIARRWLNWGPHSGVGAGVVVMRLGLLNTQLEADWGPSHSSQIHSDKTQNSQALRHRSAVGAHGGQVQGLAQLLGLVRPRPHTALGWHRPSLRLSSGPALSWQGPPEYGQALALSRHPCRPLAFSSQLAARKH